MKKFQNMEHSNSRTFQGLSRTSQGPYEPWHMLSEWKHDSEHLLHTCDWTAERNTNRNASAQTVMITQKSR